MQKQQLRESTERTKNKSSTCPKTWTKFIIHQGFVCPGRKAATTKLCHPIDDVSSQKKRNEEKMVKSKKDEFQLWLDIRKENRQKRKKKEISEFPFPVPSFMARSCVRPFTSTCVSALVSLVPEMWRKAERLRRFILFYSKNWTTVEKKDEHVMLWCCSKYRRLPQSARVNSRNGERKSRSNQTFMRATTTMTMVMCQ